jgi:hypothetical protein
MEIALWRSSSVGSPVVRAGSSIRNAKSRVSVVSRSEHLALLRWSSGELLQRQPSNRGPTGRDSRSSSRQFSKRGRSAQVRALARGCCGLDRWIYPTASSLSCMASRSDGRVERGRPNRHPLLPRPVLHPILNASTFLGALGGTAPCATKAVPSSGKPGIPVPTMPFSPRGGRSRSRPERHTT